jgi:16S rRNA (uracil1498-N3)-methyltransferase
MQLEIAHFGGYDKRHHLLSDFMKPSQRLFVTSPLAEGVPVTLTANQAHYLAHVVRLPIGGAVLLFNGQDGEWSATLSIATKKGGQAECVAPTRPQEKVPDLWLLFAPVKGDRTDYIVEKATELGAAGIIPVITERTIVRKINRERLQARAIEAAEQCERLTVPHVHEAQPLSAFLEAPTDDGILLFADEAGDTETIAAALAHGPSKVALLTGPEGGFTPAERAKLRACPHVRAVSLGPRILRADTATFAGLALVQSVWGDWQG